MDEGGKVGSITTCKIRIYLQLVFMLANDRLGIGSICLIGDEGSSSTGAISSRRAAYPTIHHGRKPELKL